MALATSTLPFSVSQRQFRIDRPARTTQLTGREPAVGNDQRIAAKVSFVLKLSAEFVEPGIIDCSGQTVILHHPLDVQILDGNHVKVLGEIIRQLVKLFLALAFNVVVQLSQLEL